MNKPEDMPEEGTFPSRTDTRMIGGIEYVLCTHPRDSLKTIIVDCPNLSKLMRLPHHKYWGYKLYLCQDCLYFTGKIREFLEACLKQG